MQAENRKKNLPLFKRLDRLRRVEELTWSQVAEKLGVSVPMLMMVKAGSRNLSEKVLARLEWAEVEAGFKGQSNVSEAAQAIGKRQGLRTPLVTENDIQNGYFDFRLEYRPEIKEPSSAETIRLMRPTLEGRTRLGVILGKTFDLEIVLLACLPDELRTQAFLESLTLPSQNALHDAALALVFGAEWRTTVAKLAVERRAGDRTAINEILGKAKSRG